METFEQLFASCLIRIESQENKLDLDWKEYFLNFLEEHGEPIHWQGRLLFRDGWQYCATNYQGPEYPPPKDIASLRGFKVAYWNLFRERLSEEIKRLEVNVNMLLEWQQQKSMPLQQRIPYLGKTEGGLPVVKRGEPTDLDLSGLNYRLDDKRRWRDEAVAELERLGQIT